MNTAEGTTLIGKSVKIVGELSGSEDLVMEGEIIGTIRLPGGRLVIGRDGRVRGDVVAKEVVVLGRMEGDIRATGRAELRGSAVVLGNVFAGSLSIEENAMCRGQIDPSRAQEPLPGRSAAAIVSRPSGYSHSDDRGIALTAPAPEGDREGTKQSAPLFAGTEA
jgi:cytoskeletal protein CcmA (bactofilin family)